MKNAIFVMVILAVLIAGCVPVHETSEKAAVQKVAAEEVNKTTSEADRIAALKEYNSKLVEAMDVLGYLAKYNDNTQSKSLASNALSKVSEFNSLIKEAENSLSGINSLNFEGKEKLVSNVKEQIKSAKELASKLSEYYSFSVEIFELQSIKNTDKTEELLGFVSSCSCKSYKCSSVKDSVFKVMDESISKTRSIGSKYTFTSYTKSAKVKEQEKAVCLEYWPKLISASEVHDADDCYRTFDKYNEYVSEIKKIQQVSDSEIQEEFSEKFIVPIDNLISKTDKIAGKTDNLMEDNGLNLS